jgi:hypothetical protein
MRIIEISDKIARLSEAGHAFETKRRNLEHQFEMTNSELREEYLAAVLEIHDFQEANMTGVTLKNNEAPANDRGCVADASHVS